MCVAGKNRWVETTGCAPPAVCCPCCYIKIPVDEPVLLDSPDVSDVEYESSTDDEEDRNYRRQASGMDEFDEETEEERRKRVEWEKAGAHALFGQGTLLQKTEEDKDLYNY